MDEMLDHAVISVISGEFDGKIYYSGPGRPHVVPKPAYPPPYTVSQLGWQSTFSNVSKQWSLLTEKQRLAWNRAAKQRTYRNRLGDRITLHGKALHDKLNMVRAHWTFDWHEWPPPILAPAKAIGMVQPLVIDLTNEVINFRFEMELPDNNSRIFLWVSKALPPQIHNAKNYYRYYGYAPIMGDNGINYADEVNMFGTIRTFFEQFADFRGPLAVGDRVFFKFKIMNYVSSIFGPEYVFSTIVT